MEDVAQSRLLEILLQIQPTHIVIWPKSEARIRVVIHRCILDI